MPRLLVDTDAFCKLALAGLLSDAVGLFGVGLEECGRLPALPHMLRRGRLPRVFGAQACSNLTAVADALPIFPDASAEWLDRLTPIAAIDLGEARIFAAAAEGGLIVVTGDKRALRALKSVPEFPRALEGRVVVLEAILLALCDNLGPDEVRRRLSAVTGSDTMIQVCFSPGNPDPRGALLSYYRDLTAELAPFVLWDPLARGGE